MTTIGVSDRLLKIDEVLTVTALSRATVYRLGAAGMFPKPRRVGPRAVRWVEREVQEWIEARPETG